MDSSEPSRELIEEVNRLKCTEAWKHAFGDPYEGNPDLGSHLFKRFADFRDALWQVHYQDLSQEDQRMLDEETHPSFKHEWLTRALPYLEELKQRLAGVEYITDVGIGAYHGDTLVLQVQLSRLVPWTEYRRHIPELFRGFMVFVVPPSDA